MAAFTKKSYLERAKGFTGRNVAAMLLLQLMDEKQSNLCVSVDVTKTEDLLRIVDEVGPHVCLIKARISSVYKGKWLE
jgi:orotidine-5'-phosphate decarboxylase